MPQSCTHRVNHAKAVSSGRLWRYASFLVVLSIILPVQGMYAQDAEVPKYEFRGAWIATVYRLDWPPVLESAQKDGMIRLLDYLQNAGINAVFFQVRSLGDAMYESSYEPWSNLLTGTQGRAPNYDPLQFTIEEAHRRGMELHAWINPYRVRHTRLTNVAGNHVTVTHPEWTYKAGEHTYLDPGKEDVRDYVSAIVMDIVRRYEVDGIHFDDYFYPYPPDHVTASNNSPDRETFQQERRGFTNILDWRRDNVNLLIEQIADSLRTFNSDLKFGISPFGIWKNGVPRGIIGLDAYNVIFADATAWIKSKTIDYLVPQLYWPFGGNQDYARLARWWSAQINDRHLYIGHALYRTGNPFSATEVFNQVVFNRSQSDISGSVFFRASHLYPHRSAGFAERMRNGLYKYPALPPIMDWKDGQKPPAPFNLTAKQDGGAVLLTWETPSDASERYAVYRVSSDSKPNAVLAAQDPRNLIALTGETRFKDFNIPNLNEGSQWYFVQSVSNNSVESETMNVVASPIRVARQTDPVQEPLSIAAYPTVFEKYVQIDYSLHAASPVTLQVFDVIGRNVATLLEGQFRQPGQYTLSLSSSEHLLPSGVYWIVLSTSHQRIAQKVIRTR